MQDVSNTTEGQESAEEMMLNEDFHVRKEFPFVVEFSEMQRKTRTHLTQVETRRHNQHWTKTSDSTTLTQLKKEQVRDPDIQRWMTQQNPAPNTHLLKKRYVIFGDQGLTRHYLWTNCVTKEISPAGDQTSSWHPFCWAPKDGKRLLIQYWDSSNGLPCSKCEDNHMGDEEWRL